MSRAPAITVDGSGNSYVSYATEASGGNVNLTTVKRNTTGTLQWAEVNTLTAAGTVYTVPEVAFLFSQPDAIDTSGSAAPTPTQITQTIVPPAQSYSSFFDAALPLAATLNVQVVGGSVITVTVPAGTEVENVTTLNLTNVGSNSISGGVATVNIGNPASTPFAVDVWYAGKNSGRTGLAPNKKRISDLQFIETAGPSVVTITIASLSATAYTMTVPYSPPTYVYDNTANGGVRYTLGEAGAPTFGNYTITATPADTSKRWSGATTPTVSGTATGLSKTLTGLSPDINYTVTVTASNSLGATGPAATTTKRTSTDAALVPTYVSGISAPFTTDLPGVQLCYGSAPVSAVVKTLTAGKWTQTLPAVGIHHSGNTGSAATGIMTFGAKMGSLTETTLAFGGFGQSAPSNSTANSWTLSSGSITDVGSGDAAGYYRQVPITVSYSASGGVTSAQTVTLRQAFAGGAADVTKTASVWWDGTATGTTPTISITAANPNTSSHPLTQVCGTSYWGSTYGFTGVEVSFTGMGTHLARANPITVTVADIAGETLFQSLNAPIGSTKTGGTASYTGASTYRRGYTMTVTGTNLHGLSGTSATYAPAAGFPVIDPAGVALNTAVTPASAPTLGSSFALGRRVSTFTADSGGTITAYNNATSLVTDTAEAIISKGYFCVPGRADAYINYPNGQNYSDISSGSNGFTSGYRYATLEWTGRVVSDPLRGGFIGVQIEAPAGVLTLYQDTAGATNMSTASASDKLKDAAGNIVDLYFNVKYSDETWLGWKDLNANDKAKRLDNAAITSGAQSDNTNLNATYSTSAGVDTFQIFGGLPYPPSGYQESSILIAAGGKGVASAGAAFKISACYKNL